MGEGNSSVQPKRVELCCISFRPHFEGLFVQPLRVWTLSPFPALSLPRWSDSQEHVVLIHFSTGWARGQLIFPYLVLALAFLCGGKFTCGFWSMRLLLGFYIASFVNKLTAGIEAQ